MSGCVDPSLPNFDNTVGVALIDSHGNVTGHGFSVPDSGCSSPISVSPSYLRHSILNWVAGNASGNDAFGVVDQFDVNVTIYKLK